MKTATILTSAALVSALVFAGCGGGEPASRPAPPPDRPTGPAPADKLIRVSARIEPTQTVEGFPKTLVVELALDRRGDLYWNDDPNGKPVSFTLTPPEGVRLSQTSAVIPNTTTPQDVAPHSARMGLAEDASLGDAWRLRVDLEAFVCRKLTKQCLRRLESHEVTPTRGP